MKNKALFLDRDGVINIDKKYVFKKDDFSFIDGIFKLISMAKKLNYKIIIITNQSGIGRGFYTEKQFLEIKDWMLREFSDNSASVDGVYFCPTHPIEGLGKYKTTDARRKPEPGMFFEASVDHSIDLSLSLFVGDKVTDMQAGEKAGIKKLFLYSDKAEYNNSKKIKKLDEVINFL